MSENDVEQLRHQLAQLNEETFQFVMGAVHDLRSQQRGICASAEILQNLLADSLPPEAHAVLSRLLESAAQTTAILNGASQYALALSSARYSLHAVDTASIVRQIVGKLEPELRASGATISFSELPEVWGDRDRLTELFRHLLDNALKYHGQLPAKIEIEAKVENVHGPDQWLFQVRDHGPGIDAKYLSELFRPFRRLHGREIPGLGIGLAICRRIAEGHGGKLWVESNAGIGLTVFFTLPAPE